MTGFGLSVQETKIFEADHFSPQRQGRSKWRLRNVDPFAERLQELGLVVPLPCGTLRERGSKLRVASPTGEE
ncbi:MAG: hypothetical protein V7K77_07285 [Nostoc sp.]|uniref:hypothetical protein n=1 Tax=Nostoc sp. TaxID=1180 RepID=UPI002FFC4BB5